MPSIGSDYNRCLETLLNIKREVAHLNWSLKRPMQYWERLQVAEEENWQRPSLFRCAPERRNFVVLDLDLSSVDLRSSLYSLQVLLTPHLRKLNLKKNRFFGGNIELLRSCRQLRELELSRTGVVEAQGLSDPLLWPSGVQGLKRISRRGSQNRLTPLGRDCHALSIIHIDSFK